MTVSPFSPTMTSDNT